MNDQLRIAIRVDSSVEMGNGHFMRCLTLAENLRSRGAEVEFITRELPGRGSTLAEDRKFTVHLMPYDPDTLAHINSLSQYQYWLGEPWPSDADRTLEILQGASPVWDWLIVDHYGLDRAWEECMRPHVNRIMVIDDLADRNHDCDLLLDQTLGRKEADYSNLLPESAALLLGPDYALLRSQFVEKRGDSLVRRGKKRPVRRILVTMGSTDPSNMTGMVLRGIINQTEIDTRVDVILGTTAPHLDAVRRQASGSSRQITVHVSVDDMASLMVEADLAIGAAGSTSWERCCLGLPTLMVVLADNQRLVSKSMVNAGAAISFGDWSNVTEAGFVAALQSLMQDDNRLQGIVTCAAGICDGLGVNRVIRAMAFRSLGNNSNQ